MRSIFKGELESYTKDGLSDIEIGRIIYISLFNEKVDFDKAYNRVGVQLVEAETDIAKYFKCFTQYYESKYN